MDEDLGQDTEPGDRGWISATVRMSVLVAVIVCVGLGALWTRLLISPIAIPDGFESRAEARIDAAMTAGDVAIGDMVLVRSGDSWAPALEFHDVVLRAPDGHVRVAFPVVRLHMAAAPLLLGQARVARIVLAGASVTLTRDADGRVGLDLSSAPSSHGAAQPLSDTLLRLDQMFARPAFAYLREVSGVDMAVTVADAMTQRDIQLRGADLRLTRDAGHIGLVMDGTVDGMVDGAATQARAAQVNLSLRRDIGLGVTDATVAFDGLAARDLAAAAPGLEWLDRIRAPLGGRISTAIGDDGSIGALVAQLQMGAGEVTFSDLATSDRATAAPFDAIELDVTYAPNTRRARLDRVDVTADQLTFHANGHVDISEDGQVLTGQVVLQDLDVDPDGMFDEAVSIDGAAVDLRLTLGETVRVEVGQAVVHDGDLRLRGSGHLSLGPGGLTLSLDAHIPQIDVETVLTYWPTTAIPNTRWWVEDRMIAGTAMGADFAVRSVPGADTAYDLSFDFTGADLVAVPGAPPLRGAAGFLSLHNDSLVVALSRGGIAAPGRALGQAPDQTPGQAPVDLSGSRMRIPDTGVIGPLAEFDLDVSATVPSLLRVLAGPPFHVLQASGYSPDEIGQGRVVGEVRLSTYLGEQSQQLGVDGIEITASGVVTDYRAQALIPGRSLTANRMAVAMTSELLSVGGTAQLDGVPVTGQWRVLLDPAAPPGSVVEARATIDRTALSTFGVDLPEWLISGAGLADLTVDLRPGAPARVRVRSDLSGIALAIPPLAWSMEPAETGAFEADITLGPRPEVRTLTLDGADLSLEGAVTFTADGGLNRFSAGRFHLGQWLDVRGGLIGRGAASPRIEVTGGTLDFRTMPSLSDTGGAGQGDVGTLDISLGRLQITEGIALTGLRADLDGASGSGEFRGRVNGDARINGQVVPSANGPSVRLQSDDAGAILRSADIFGDMYGGAFDLILAARAEAGEYDGRLTIDGPRLRDAPVMAELLNLISVVGLLDQLSGDGINLGDINADFRLTPRAITVQQGTALGPSMGVSMDGVYDMASEQYQMQGVISPLYIVNGFIGALFSQRREGLFGFNYRLIGGSENTRVTVNPLSILTPGVFRDMFRAPPPNFSPQGN